MARAKTYPPASTTAQWYADTHPGVTMATIDRLTVHTTEGSGWPGYDGGAVAPTWTALPVQTDGTWQLLWRQHFPADMSARALVNAPGGVETNTLRDAQVELVGTCVPGGPGVYWPAAPDSLLAGVAGLVAWLHTEWQVPLLTAPLWLPYPSSYGASRARLSPSAWTAFSGVCGHQHVPENCVDSRAVILCADLTWKPAADLRVGDEIVAFDEQTMKIGNCNGGRKYRPATVLRNVPSSKPCSTLTTSQGSVVASDDHPWLIRMPYVNRGSRLAWVKTADLVPGRHEIYSIGQPWELEDSREAGWLAGVLDADGHAFAGGRSGSHVGFGQVDGPVLDMFVACAERRGWNLNINRRDWSKRTGTKRLSENPKDFTDLRVKGGLWETIRLLGTLRPERLINTAMIMWQDAAVGKTTGTVPVISVEPVGVHDVASLTTSSGTFIAEGMLCHNTHGDPGNLNIGRILQLASGGTVTHDPITTADAQLVADVEETRYQVHGPGGLETRDQAIGEDLAADARQELVLAQILARLDGPVNVTVDVDRLAEAVAAKIGPAVAAAVCDLLVVRLKS